MAKNDNLQDFLTDVADAIRAKKGTTEKINPQDFSSEIASIQSGVEPKEMKDVNFYDYDGTILYSYTWDEALQLTEMPPLPDRTSEGLTCDGWNWTLEEMQANEGLCDVGALYYPTNGRAKLYLTIEEDDERNRTFYLRLGAWGGNFEGVIYWGDGEELAISHNDGTSHTYSHTYSAGDYILELETIKGHLSLGYNVVVSVAGKNNDAYQTIGHSFVRKVVLSKDCRVFEGGLYQLPNLEYLIRSTDNDGGMTMLSQCKIKHINLPRTTTRALIGSNSLLSIAPSGEVCSYSSTCMNLNHLKRFVVRVGSSASGQFFHMDYHLKTVHGITMKQLEPNTFQNNLLMREAPPFEDSISSIGHSCFNGCINLKKLVIPSSVTSIAQGAFNVCSSMRYYDFTKLSAVPTLDNANAFAGIQADCEIRVPMALVDEWKAATNWSTYADYIVGY